MHTLFRIILIITIATGIAAAIHSLQVEEVTVTSSPVGYPAPGTDAFTSPDEVVWPLCYDTDNGVYCKYPTPTLAPEFTPEP